MLPKNGTLQTPEATMDYIRFGSGRKILVMLSGLGDGLKTVKGTAFPMALMYAAFGSVYTVYAFSRRKELTEGFTTRDMARDVKAAMDTLGIQKADVFGVSMGGMIAQHLAIDYPEAVGKLVLAVTCPRSNPILERAVSQWVAAAKAGDHAAFLDSNLRLIYSDAYYQKNKWVLPLIGTLTRPKTYDRFFLLAQACLEHDTCGSLSAITAPTLVIGGGLDQALGCKASRELAECIPQATLHIYPQWGHGVYEEEKGFNSLVLNFLTGGNTYAD